MLDRRMRQSWPSRVTAVGFIVVILFGNLWLVHAMTGAMTPEWIEGGFAVGVTGAVCGGLGLAVLALWRRLRGETDGPADDGDDGDDGDDDAPAAADSASGASSPVVPPSVGG